MTNTIKVVLLTSVVLSGVLGYTLSTPKESNVVSVHASWGKEQPSVKSLLDESDLVVVGTLKEEIKSYQPFDGYEHTFTDGTIELQRVLKGPPLEEVVLSQYGGVRMDGKVEVFDDLPLLENSKTYLLFLSKINDNTERNGKYQVTGGPQGLYELARSDSKLMKTPDAELSDFSIFSFVDGEINQKVIDMGLDTIADLAKEPK
ncbi:MULTISPECIES: hypothetical protein [Brevibacillus]|uniref:hypothetical protein n=1 Tax=Brevibacillus TaxID=55080 RepID=UPI000EC3F2E3|nr:MULTISPECIES: hypothetical protein [Brevibacillus]MDR4999740.1 hypothetical protein [Brevibacillus parabrevis]MED1724891.1 hypothetical protein [Brevibacillus parabrevis]MED2257070.1 hypothetical protein [Brevibacillus parabrevis]UED69734.1 hypothetical protein HP435_03545 [Brevibacillus sp. HD3.3A]WDV96014.1 hypothetical protein PSE45_03395 [Brevibacillus parabrevis]